MKKIDIFAISLVCLAGGFLGGFFTENSLRQHQKQANGTVVEPTLYRSYEPEMPYKGYIEGTDVHGESVLLRTCSGSLVIIPSNKVQREPGKCEYADIIDEQNSK